jgi:hypothetical protein
VVFGVRLGGFVGMMGCVETVGRGGDRVMRSCFVFACIVVIRRLLVMACRVFVMLRRFPVMLCCLFRHLESPCLCRSLVDRCQTILRKTNLMSLNMPGVSTAPLTGGT